MNAVAAFAKAHLRQPLTRVRRPKDFPDALWFSGLKDFIRFTPDAPELERSQFHFVFFYDCMMRGRPEYIKMNPPTEFRTHGFTDQTFHMWRKKLGLESFPIALEKNDPNDTTPWADGNRFINRFEQNARIKGEIHKIPTNFMFDLDKHYLNSVEFIRKRVRIEIPWKQKRTFDRTTSTIEKVRYYDAWMYVGNPEYWYGLGDGWSCYKPKDQGWDTIDGGFLFEPVKIYNGRSEYPPYYYYSLLEGHSD